MAKKKPENIFNFETVEEKITDTMSIDEVKKIYGEPSKVELVWSDERMAYVYHYHWTTSIKDPKHKKPCLCHLTCTVIRGFTFVLRHAYSETWL